MKPLKESIFDDIDDIVNNDTLLIDEFIKKNYEIRRGTYVINKDRDIGASYTIKDGVVDVEGNVDVKNLKLKTLTDGLFRFGKVSGSFDCSDCCNLTTLEGAPEEVGWRFYCTNCSKLTSLEGAPKKVNTTFDCGGCKNITSLKGAPEEVGENFYCDNCHKLKSLEGAPKKVGEDFCCFECDGLKTLDGAPEKIGGKLYCHSCKNLSITLRNRMKYRIRLRRDYWKL